MIGHPNVYLRQVEHVSISRDTTESDLKQRREIRGGSVEYSDQPVVEAALHGRVLVRRSPAIAEPLGRGRGRHTHSLCAPAA